MMRKMTMFVSMAVMLAFVFGLSAVSQAAVITWSSEMLVSDGQNVASDGILFNSVDYGASAGDVRIINGVNFNLQISGQVHPNWAAWGNRNSANSYYGTAGDLGIKDTTDIAGWNSPLTLGIRGLTVESEYRIQLISFDSAVWDSPVAVRDRLQTISSPSNDGSLGFSQFFKDGLTPASADDVRAALVAGTWIADSTDFDVTMPPPGMATTTPSSTHMSCIRYRSPAPCLPCF